MEYWDLFWSFFQVGLFSIGGGYAAMPLIQQQVVEIHPWLSVTEFTDIITISQMTPGPIAINSATFVGIRVAGIPGALLATLGCILPSCIIVLTLGFLYYRYRKLSMVQGVLQGLRPAVVAMIGSAGLSILLLCIFGRDTAPFSFQQIDWIALLIFVAGITVLRKWKLNPIHIMLGSGIIGLLLYSITDWLSKG